MSSFGACRALEHLGKVVVVRRGSIDSPDTRRMRIRLQLLLHGAIVSLAAARLSKSDEEGLVSVLSRDDAATMRNDSLAAVEVVLEGIKCKPQASVISDILCHRVVPVHMIDCGTVLTNDNKGTIFLSESLSARIERVAHFLSPPLSLVSITIKSPSAAVEAVREFMANDSTDRAGVLDRMVRSVKHGWLQNCSREDHSIL